MIDVTVPSPGESINEVQVAAWLVEDGDFVEKDQDIVEIDSDKATLPLASPADGKIKIIVEEGETIEINTLIAQVDETAKGAPTPDKKEAAPAEEKAVEKVAEKDVVQEVAKEKVKKDAPAKSDIDLTISPLARKLMDENNVGEVDLVDFFKNYRIGKTDVEFFLKEKDNAPKGSTQVAASSNWKGERTESRKKMTMLRKKLGQRLVSVKNETAMLTTFNEVNMTPIMSIRSKYKDAFKEQFAIGLGFMSFFTKAVTEAMAYFPQINSQMSGDEVISYDYVDVSIAVSGPKGLVVPVVRNAEMLSLDQIELKIKELAIKARDNKITLEEMQGGTFTITNGGVFGSMMSTPIINPPQSAILGMHNIVQRPIAVNGKVEIHPMMYIAMSYDHRIIDGRESVGFLVKVKEMLEDPIKMLYGGKDSTEVLLGM